MIVNGLIAFCMSSGGHQQIFTINADGTGLQQLTTGTTNYQWCRWSKDGKFLLAAEPSYGSDRNVWILQADGTVVRLLSNIDTSAASIGFWQGDWSPDGSQVVMLGGSASNDLQIVNVDNSGHTAVTLSKKVSLYANSVISWSPDGTKFLFSTAGAFYGTLDATTCHIDGSSSTDLLVADGSVIIQYLPWGWYADSTNILVAKHPFTGADSLLKSDGATTSVLYSGAALNVISTLGALSPDEAGAAWNDQASAGIVVLASGSTHDYTQSGFIESDGITWKAAVLRPGNVSAGTPQQGLLHFGH